MWDLKNKTVVISGATNGIGKAAAIELSKEYPKLIFTYRNKSLAQDLLAEIKDLSRNTNVLPASIKELNNSTLFSRSGRLNLW